MTAASGPSLEEVLLYSDVREIFEHNAARVATTSTPIKSGMPTTEVLEGVGAASASSATLLRKKDHDSTLLLLESGEGASAISLIAQILTRGCVMFGPEGDEERPGDDVVKFIRYVLRETAWDAELSANRAAIIAARTSGVQSVLRDNDPSV